jgi:hypothetical protein
MGHVVDVLWGGVGGTRRTTGSGWTMGVRTGWAQQRVVWRGFFWGDSLYLLAGGVGQNRATRVFKGIPRPRRLTLGFCNRGFEAGAL